MRSFYEFFAGGGMARAGLGAGWSCLFANDFDAKKGETYRLNYPADDVLRVDDVRKIKAKELVIYGEKDAIVPPEISRGYVKLKKAKERVEPLVLPNAGHFELIDPRTKEWKQIEAAVNKI